jgi:hypothetical protein
MLVVQQVATLQLLVQTYQSLLMVEELVVIMTQMQAVQAVQEVVQLQQMVRHLWVVLLHQEFGLVLR